MGPTGAGWAVGRKMGAREVAGGREEKGGYEEKIESLKNKNSKRVKSVHMQHPGWFASVWCRL